MDQEQNTPGVGKPSSTPTPEGQPSAAPTPPTTQAPAGDEGKKDGEKDEAPKEGDKPEGKPAG